MAEELERWWEGTWADRGGRGQGQGLTLDS